VLEKGIYKKHGIDLTIITGEIEAVETTSGIALGVMEDFSFQSKRVVLNKGDAIFIYSDGVTEAMNSRHELFSEARLEDELDRLKGLPVEDIIAGVMEKIREFSQGEPQTDDITMMVIQYNGSDGITLSDLGMEKDIV